jgi:hypothetical protein
VTTVILKMQLAPDKKGVGKPIYALVTMLPLAWLLAVTGTASVQKVLHPKANIGFLAKAKVLTSEDLPKAEQALIAANETRDVGAIAGAEKKIKSIRSQIRNQYLNAGVTSAFLLMVILITLISVREWILLLARKKLAEIRETMPVWLPDYAIVESRPLHLLAWIGLAFALARELSGEAAMDRVQKASCECVAHEHGEAAADDKIALGETRKEIYIRTLDEKFKGVRRCC